MPSSDSDICCSYDSHRALISGREFFSPFFPLFFSIFPTASTASGTYSPIFQNMAAPRAFVALVIVACCALDIVAQSQPKLVWSQDKERLFLRFQVPYCDLFLWTVHGGLTGQSGRRCEGDGDQINAFLLSTGRNRQVRLARCPEFMGLSNGATGRTGTVEI